MDTLTQFREHLSQSKKIVGFTGAGISTESGIPDYRGKGGIWERFQPVYYNEFLHDPEKRMLYWQRKTEMWPSIRDARPNQGHLFFKQLYDQNRLRGLITQNIDGLHEKSGLPGELIVNLHGSALQTVCLSCGYSRSSQQVYQEFDPRQGPPLCPQCGGLVKPATISFGQNLRPRDVEQAYQLSVSCDLMIVLGSTLKVHPAASFPLHAKNNGAKLVIITLSPTPLDQQADLVFHKKIGEFMEALGDISL